MDIQNVPRIVQELVPGKQITLAHIIANPDDILDATAAAVVAMGLCGELAEKKMAERNEGTASFRTYLIDNMSRLTAEILNGGMKVEIR